MIFLIIFQFYSLSKRRFFVASSLVCALFVGVFCGGITHFLSLKITQRATISTEILPDFLTSFQNLLVDDSLDAFILEFR